VKILDSQRLFSSKEINIELAKIATPTGKIFEQLFIDPIRNGVAAVVIKKGKIILIKTKRVLWHKPTWEIPGGWIKEGELALSAIRRKVEDETGFKVLDIKRIGNTFPDISMNKKEKFYFFIEVGERIQDFNRDIIESVSTFNIKQIKNLINTGNIIDERTITGLTLAENKGYI
jgi:ADP-ribose pyrophosphatase